MKISSKTCEARKAGRPGWRTKAQKLSVTRKDAVPRQLAKLLVHEFITILII